MIETRYKIFAACARRADHRGHQECAGAYIGRAHDENPAVKGTTAEWYEIRWQCSCPHHKMSNASVQGDFWKSESSAAPRLEERTPKQGKLL